MGKIIEIKNGPEKLVPDLSLDGIDEIKKKYGHKVRKSGTKKLGKPYLRCVWVPNKRTGRPYWQLARHFVGYDGKDKIIVMYHFGPQKPTTKQVSDVLAKIASGEIEVSFRG